MSSSFSEEVPTSSGGSNDQNPTAFISSPSYGSGKTKRVKNEEINFQNIFKALKSKTSIVYIVMSLTFAGMVSITLCWGYLFFSIFIEHFVGFFMFMIFTLLIFAQHRIWNGFFMVIGIGYGFLCIFRLVYIVTGLAFFSKGFGVDDPINRNLQIRNTSDFIEVCTFIVALLISTKSFKGLRPPIITFCIYLLVSFFFFSAIFWWNIIPDCWVNGAVGEATRFNYIFQWTIAGCFFGLILLLALKRNSFAVDTFSFLIIALILRSISCLMNGISNRFQENPTNIILDIFKLIAISYIFNCVGLATLQNPTKTLFENLKSHRKALKNEKLFAEWMIDQVPAVIVLLNHDGDVTHLNKTGKKMFNVTSNEVIGHNFMDLFVGEDPHKIMGETEIEDRETKYSVSVDRQRKFAQALDQNNKEDVVFEASFPISERYFEWKFTALHISSKVTPPKEKEKEKNKDKEKDIEMSKAKADESESDSQDSRIVVLCMGQDITERFQKVSLLVKDKNEAQQLSELKDTFIANVSHELRTPLNCIVGVTSLLVDTILNTKQKDMVTMISNSATVLLDLINDLLDVNSIRQGTLKLRNSELDIRKFIEEIVFSVSLHSQAQASVDFGYHVDSSCPRVIMTDGRRLRQVLINLLSNAIKFTFQGQIIVKVTVNERKNKGKKNYLEITVSDSGLGIQKQDIEKLFHRFTQLDDKNNRKFQGTGIGLHISKQLVELLGGEIGVKSKFGKGSKFWVTIPFDVIKYPPLPDPIPIDRDEHTVLIYLSNKKIGELIYRAMHFDYGFHVKVSESTSQLNSEIFEILKYYDPIDTSVCTMKGIKRAHSFPLPNSTLKIIRKSKSGLGIERKISFEDNKDTRLRRDSSDLDDYMSSSSVSTSDSTVTLSLPSLPKYMDKLTIILESSSIPSLDVEQITTLVKLYKIEVQIAVIIEAKSTSDSPRSKIFNSGSNFQFNLIEKSFFDTNLISDFNREMEKLGVTVIITPKPTQISWLVDRFRTDREVSRVSSYSTDLDQNPEFVKIQKLDSMNQISENLALIESSEENIPTIRIMVVDDNLVNQKVICMLLNKMPLKFEVELAVNGEQALNLYKKGKFDLILMDCQMPVMDGYQATVEIRKLEEEKLNVDHVVIIAITANAMDEDKKDWQTAGMDAYLVKPINFKSLRDKLSDYLKIAVPGFNQKEIQQNNISPISQSELLK